jgi:transposase
MDEHRIGLKPIHRRVWAPIGERPLALGHHRYEWLYVTAFVAPMTGETVWYLSNGIDKPFFAELLKAFARTTGAGRDRRIVLQLDNAGWHGPENLSFPDGIRPVYQPAYSAELQPAEHLWPLLDEPLVNKYFDTIDDLDGAVASQCCALSYDQTTVASATNFHWWPKSINPS